MKKTIKLTKAQYDAIMNLFKRNTLVINHGKAEEEEQIPEETAPENNENAAE